MTLPYGLKTSLIRGRTSRLASSLRLGWRGFGVEHHLVPRGAKEETLTGLHVVSIAAGGRPSYGQRMNRRGRLEGYSKTPQSFTVSFGGVLPAIAPATDTELIVCAFEPEFVRAVAEENDTHPPNDTAVLEGIQDPPVWNLGNLFLAEARSGGLSGKLYVDYLAHALVLRLLSLWKMQRMLPFREASLPTLSLRRVMERMQADPSANWDLATLAGESGFSRNHFIRMFRKSIGLTPHRYLLQLRVEKAKSMLKQRRQHLIDIAASCGFANEAHLSRTFRALLGVNPSEYRRNVAY
jgi:AraC family transcriptional regulator